MENKQIASIINDTILKNQFSLGRDAEEKPIMIAEDLSNIVDWGKKVSELTGSEFLDYSQTLAVGVLKTYFDGRTLGETSYGLEESYLEYGGAIQRVKAKLYKPQDSAILDPVSVYVDPDAPSYHDGHFYGMTFDARLYDKSGTFKIVTSISEPQTKKMFLDAKGVADWFGFMEANLTNSMNNIVGDLALATLREVVRSAIEGGRRINLIPRYNAAMGFVSEDPGFITIQNWKGSEAFKLYCQEIVIRIKKAMRVLNMKFNDSSFELPTFTPADDIRVYLLDEFGTAVDFAQSSVYHKELTDIGRYESIPYWQASGTEMLEDISETSWSDKLLEDGGESDDVENSYIIGLIMDKYTAGINIGLNMTTVEPVGANGFVNYHHHFNKQHYVDPRNAAVVLALDADPV